MNAGPSTEKLLAQPPNGWVKVYQLNQDGNRITEFIPADEDKYKWAHKVTFESFPVTRSADPIDLLLYEVEQYKKRCNFVQHFNLFSGIEKGHATSLRLVMCGKSNVQETGEVTIFKAIQGRENFYIVRISRKVPAFEPHKSILENEEVKQWSLYLKRISLCSEDSPDYPCTNAL